jgi:hypothetical protein
MFEPVVHTTPQQECGDLLALGPQIVHRRFARPREFTYCLMLPIRNPHRAQIAAA